MRPETVLEYARATPFRPFRIVMNRGHFHDVAHPEMIRVSNRDAFILFFPDVPGTSSGRYETCSLLHIEHIEHMEELAAD